MEHTSCQSLIDSVKGKSLFLGERKDLAITLASQMMQEVRRSQTTTEQSEQKRLAGMIHDPIGKLFATTLTDQCFRSHRPQRIANQIVHVIQEHGIPHYLPISTRLALQLLSFLGKPFAPIAIPLAIRMIRNEIRHVILPGEEAPLREHLRKRKQEGVRINLNRLGEAILGEEEAKRRLDIYLEDLSNPAIEYISVKISTLFSQINLLAWQETLNILADRLRQLYRTAMTHRFKRADGTLVPKFVNLDMEEYRDLELTVALFRQVLSEEEFKPCEAGIVLQSYLPDSFPIQQELTHWAMQRVRQGGAPIKIRLVKGANLAMEQLEAALRLWPQAPYTTKLEADANFKRMLLYGCQKEHAQAVHLGIGSHNLFDIAFVLMLRAENGVEKEVEFEMLEGMAEPMRRVVQKIAGNMLLYCPTASQEEFQNAVAYLVRRLDENTAPENFLSHLFNLQPGSSVWQEQVDRFSKACLDLDQVSQSQRRRQNREKEEASRVLNEFQNEPNTDWSLSQNREWGEKILKDWQTKTHPPIPLVIGDENLFFDTVEKGVDPCYPEKTLFHYQLANEDQIEQAITTAKQKENEWGKTSLQERLQLLAKVASEIKHHRAELIGAMVANTGKTIFEADIEVSEAIDFANYYRLNLEEWHQLPDIEWKPKGTLLVAPPWNFPCSIPAGGILAALASGNCVIFKPPAESVLVGWTLAQLFWKGGISREVLQFVTCVDDPVGSLLVKDLRISAIVLTGATATAKLFYQLQPGIDLIAETGGKNTMVISALSDRDLAIKNLLESAFGHAGQKCSACSLAILEAEVYDDPHFLQQLKDAAASLPVGSQWDPKTKINPLIRPPNPTLMRGLTQLEEGESWLLEPKQDPQTPTIWSPGIKLGVQPSRFTYQNELFGPILGLVRAENMEHAFTLMNQTPYGLTAGIHSLDDREQEEWLNRIEAGNCYINRTITGAIVGRQPFGGYKQSSFGPGLKAGGPNYLMQFMHAEQFSHPSELAKPNEKVQHLASSVEKDPLLASNLHLWKASLGSYAFYWNDYFSGSHDPSLVRGQDNFLKYLPHAKITFRFQRGDSLFDLCRILAAAFTCGTAIEVSCEESLPSHLEILPISIHSESNEEFAKRIINHEIDRIRMVQLPPPIVQNALSEAASHFIVAPVLANGRIELLHFLREVSISHDYHRYGNLGAREHEKRR